jgi:hypothetical protein
MMKYQLLQSLTRVISSEPGIKLSLMTIQISQIIGCERVVLNLYCEILPMGQETVIESERRRTLSGCPPADVVNFDKI